MKFRRRVKIFPGVKLNISKSGISTSIGVRGASVTLGAKGVYFNYGIPGTGIYDRVKLSPKPNFDYIKVENFHMNGNQFILDYQPVEIKSQDIENLTSTNLSELQDILQKCYQERIEIKSEICSLKTKIFIFYALNIISKLCIIGFFIKRFGNSLKEKNRYLVELNKDLDHCFVDIDISLENSVKSEYNNLCNGFNNLCDSCKIWSVSSFYNIDRVRERTAFGMAINKEWAEFSVNKSLDIIKSSFNPLVISNFRISIFIYPSFVLVLDTSKKFSIIEFNDIKLCFSEVRFVETEQVPEDSKILYYAWSKSNKDGSPDLRFKNNYQIPVCQYGRIDLWSERGLNESFQISNYYNAKRFAEYFNSYSKKISVK